MRLPPSRPRASTRLPAFNLTTVLAHASGERIASDWPVCAIAALTYAAEVFSASIASLRKALAPHLDGASVRLRGAMWLVSSAPA
jgi:hypothetical protein